MVVLGGGQFLMSEVPLYLHVTPLVAFWWPGQLKTEREFIIDNLLVRIHFIIVMIG